MRDIVCFLLRYSRSTKQIKTSFIFICAHLIVSLNKILALDRAKKNKFYLHLCSLNRIFAAL